MTHQGEAPRGTLDQRKLEALLSSYEKEQRFFLGALAGSIAAVAGATAWAFVTLKTGYQIGWMAVAVGFLVGFAIRFAGRGVQNKFGYLGAALSLFGCLLGNVLTIVAVISQEEGAPLLSVFLTLASAPSLLLEMLASTFHPMDLLFYGIAVYEGFQFSFRQLNDEDVAAVGKTYM